MLLEINCSQVLTVQLNFLFPVFGQNLIKNLFSWISTSHFKMTFKSNPLLLHIHCFLPPKCLLLVFFTDLDVVSRVLPVLHYRSFGLWSRGPISGYELIFSWFLTVFHCHFLNVLRGSIYLIFVVFLYHILLQSI